MSNDSAKSESCQVGIIENIPSRHYDAGMEKKPYPSETQERFIIRLPEGMRDRIAESAKANNRSMNAEIVARIQNSFEAQEDVRQLLAPMEEKLNEIGRLLLRQEEARTPEEKRYTPEQTRALKEEINKAQRKKP